MHDKEMDKVYLTFYYFIGSFMLSKVLLVSAAILATLLLYLLSSCISQDKPISGIAAFADHGQEITLTLYNSSFGSLTSGGGNQVSVFANYKLNDNSIAGQTINAVMEVYAPNGTLIRTSSYPSGFVAQSSGGVEGLETTIKDPTLQSVTANVTFRNADKTEALSNNLRVNLNIGEEGTTAPTTGEEAGVEEGALVEEPEQEQAPSPPLQPPEQEEDGGENIEEEGEDGEDGEQDELPLPLFGNE
jgi:hypothetical protein